MRIIFMGSASFACPSLERLLADGLDEVIAVVTQPDRPKGRNLEWSACPVKHYLEERAIQVFTPEKVNTPESLAALNQLKPDLVVVVAYGQFLKPDLLSMPAIGCINVHGSLLPKYRGAAPIQWAVANGERVTGVTTMHVNERLDAGDMILKREVPIEAGDTGGILHDKLAAAGAELLSATLDLIRSGKAPRLPQDEAQATVAPKLKKADGRIDWGWAAATIHNRVRAFNPWPGCYCETPRAPGKFVKVLKTRVEPGYGKPGTVMNISGEGPLIQAGDGSALRLLEVQPEGRRPMSGSAFMCGRALIEGEILS